MSKKVPFLVGADPEAFLINKEGKFISSVGLIGGTKWSPRDMGNGFAIQEDNVAVEFNIPPVADADSFVKVINHGLDLLRENVQKYGLDLAFVPSVVFENEQLNTPQAREFGCEPDINAWTKRFNPRPRSKNAGLRSTGFHVHISSEADPFLLGRWMDALVGAPAVLVDPDKCRRQLYGRAGAMRVKPYPGIEYRVLSSFFLGSDDLKYWVFEQTRKAAEAAEAGKQINRTLGSKIRKAINRSDQSFASLVGENFDFGKLPIARTNQHTA